MLKYMRCLPDDAIGPEGRHREESVELKKHVADFESIIVRYQKSNKYSPEACPEPLTHISSLPWP